jgi:hypothetical protein
VTNQPTSLSADRNIHSRFKTGIVGQGPVGEQYNRGAAVARGSETTRLAARFDLDISRIMNSEHRPLRHISDDPWSARISFWNLPSHAVHSVTTFDLK